MQVERTDLVSSETGQVSGERVSNTWATYPEDWDNPGKPGLIPDTLPSPHDEGKKGRAASASGWARGPLACW